MSFTSATTALHYAVALGCNTPERLAREWDISAPEAKVLLYTERTKGGLRIRDGVFCASRFVEEEVRQ